MGKLFSSKNSQPQKSQEEIKAEEEKRRTYTHERTGLSYTFDNMIDYENFAEIGVFKYPGQLTGDPYKRGKIKIDGVEREVYTEDFISDSILSGLGKYLLDDEFVKLLQEVFKDKVIEFAESVRLSETSNNPTAYYRKHFSEFVEEGGPLDSLARNSTEKISKERDYVLAVQKIANRPILEGESDGSSKGSGSDEPNGLGLA